MAKQKSAISIENILKKARNSCGTLVAILGAVMPTVIFALTAIGDMKEITQNLARYIEPALQRALVDDNHLSSEELVESFKKLQAFDSITYVALHDSEGRFIANWHRQATDKRLHQLPEKDFRRDGPIVYSKYYFRVTQTNTGYYTMVGLDSRTYIKNCAFSYILGTVFVILITFCGIYIVWKFLLSSIIMPIINLANNTAEFINSNNLNFQIICPEENEIGILGQNINKLINKTRETVLNVKKISGQVDSVLRDLGQTWNALCSHSNQIGQATQQNSENLKDLVVAFQTVSSLLESLTSQAEIGATTIQEMSQINQESIGNNANMSESVIESLAVLEELSIAIQGIASNINSLQQNTTTVTNSMQKMTKTVSEEEQNSQESMILAKRLAADALKGQQTMEKASEGINKIQDNTTQVFKAVTVLNQHAMEIGSILDIIDEVSKQTSLLALNADIIAVQAGEHGRGFDIVAQELATLAASTETAAQSVANLINSIQESGKKVVSVMEKEQEFIKAGVENGQKCAQIFSNLQNLAANSAEQAQIIARESIEQASVVQTVATTIEGINQAIQEINASSQNQANDASALTNAAVQMKQLTQQVDISTSEQYASSQKVLAAINDINVMADDTKRQQAAQGDATKSTLDAIRAMGQSAAAQHREATRLGTLIESIRQQINTLNEQLGGFNV